MEARTRKRRWLIAAAVGAVVLALGLALFKPWLLFVDVRVDEQLPTVVASAGLSPSVTAKPPSGMPTTVPSAPVQLAEGSLISHEHATTGTVRIIQQPAGTAF
jgi:hypothetical protein